MAILFHQFSIPNEPQNLCKLLCRTTSDVLYLQMDGEIHAVDLKVLGKDIARGILNGRRQILLAAEKAQAGVSQDQEEPKRSGADAVTPPKIGPGENDGSGVSFVY